ncbi:MAG: ATP-binding domain-containing protein [Acutalibacteraceae bacterium]
MVLIPVFACPYPLMTRNLLYTAVTRAKDMVILAGSTDCIRTMVRNDRKALRSPICGICWRGERGGCGIHAVR